VVTVAAKRVATIDKGLLTLEICVENQNGQIVQQGHTRLMAKRHQP